MPTQKTTYPSYSEVVGLEGEHDVRWMLMKLDSTKYKKFHDIFLPADYDVTMAQIDHIVVSQYGVFCIETKAHKGWIFGSWDDTYWTQTFLFDDNKKVKNPKRQNYSHKKSIELLLKSALVRSQIIEIVVFTNAGKLAKEMQNVVMLEDLIKTIKKYNKVVYTEEEVKQICNLIRNSNITDKNIRKLHPQKKSTT